MRSSEEQFSPLAADYAKSAYHAGGPDLEALLLAANLKGSENILDLGCGPGHAGLFLAPHASSVIGLDPSGPMLDEARKLAADQGVENVEWVVGDAKKLPWEDGRFHRVVSRKSVHHWAEPQGGINEASRVLAPQGRLLVIDTLAPADPDLDSYLNQVEALRDPSHVKDYSVVEWEGMLGTAGLKLTHLQRFQLRLSFDEWVGRARTPEASVTQLQAVIVAATPRCREAFDLAENGDLTLPYGLLVAERA